MITRLFSLCTLKERAAIDKASPIAVPWMGTDSVVMEFKNILADMGIKIYTIGVGSAQGKPIPYKGEYLKDKDGNMVVTRLDENTLREIARVGGGAYIHAGNEEFGLNPIIDDIRRLQQEEFSNVVFEEYDEQYMYFFAIALALLALEALVGQRRAKRQLFD